MGYMHRTGQVFPRKVQSMIEITAAYSGNRPPIHKGHGMPDIELRRSAIHWKVDGSATGNLPSVAHIPAAPSWSGVPDCPLPYCSVSNARRRHPQPPEGCFKACHAPRRTHSLASGQKRLESFHAYSLTELLGEPAPPARRSRPSGEPAPAAPARRSELLGVRTFSCCGRSLRWPTMRPR